MKSPTKALAATLLLLASTSAYAGFEVTNNGIAVSLADNSANTAMILEINKTTNNPFISYSTIVNNVNNLNCGDETTVINVNEVNVKFKVIAHGLQCSAYPATQLGNEYLVKEFKTKSNVTFGSVSFSATGFNKALNTLRSHVDAI